MGKKRANQKPLLELQVEEVEAEEAVVEDLKQ